MLSSLKDTFIFVIYDKILVGKMSLLASNFALVFFCAVYLDENFANSVFQVLALSTFIVSLTSFGSNATLVKRIVGESREYSFSLFNSLIVLKVLLLLLVFLIIKVFYNPVPYDLINAVIVSSACLMLMVYDYLAEAFGEKYLEMLSVIKIFVTPATLLIKVYFLLNFQDVGILLIQVDWFFISFVFVCVLFIKYRSKMFVINRNAFFKELPSLIFNNIYIWFSNVLQIGWSRGIFLIFSSTLSTAVANNYFVLIRVIESLVFMPNAISARHFPNLVKNMNNIDVLNDLKILYLKNHIKVSVLSSFMVCIVMAGYFIWVEVALIEAVIVILTSFFISLLYFLRSSLSRELVLTGLVSWSLYSYLIACFFGFMTLFLLEPTGLVSATIVYGMFVASTFIAPLVLAKRNFKSYIDSFCVAIRRGS